MFYLSKVCKDQLTFSVCLFDLLKSCGHPWHVTSAKLLVTLLNLGARDQLVIKKQFYQLNRLPAPLLPRFYTVQLLAELVRMPDRNLRPGPSLGG